MAPHVDPFEAEAAAVMAIDVHRVASMFPKFAGNQRIDETRRGAAVLDVLMHGTSIREAAEEMNVTYGRAYQIVNRVLRYAHGHLMRAGYRPPIWDRTRRV